MTTIVAPPSNASKWQMGFNSAFKGLISPTVSLLGHLQGYHSILSEGPHVFVTIKANIIYPNAAQ
jgi:hypothetical protein